MRTRAVGAATLAALALLAACGTDSAAPGVTQVGVVSSDPAAAASSTLPASSVEPEGFSTITARITETNGEVCDVCVWLADTPDERGRGLMGVNDLGDAAGMAFRFEEPSGGSFYMFNTPTPLSIAWFGPEGDHVGSADMAPCMDTPAGECPLYSPGASHGLALEVFAGGLEPLGIGAGSRLELLEGTEAERCPESAS